MTLRFLLLQRGFSLVQGMVLSAALAGTALVGVRLIEDQKTAVKTAEIKDSTESLHGLVKGILQDRANCIATMMSVNLLMGNSIPAGTTLDFTRNAGNPNRGIYTRVGGLTSAPTLVFRTKIQGGAFTPSDVYMAGTVWIKDMKLVIPADLTQTAEFQITYERMADAGTGRGNQTGTGGKTLKKTIFMMLQRQTQAASAAGGPSTVVAGNLFDGCYAVTSKTVTSGDDSTLVNSNRDLNEDFCANLETGVAGDKKSIFEWNEAARSCVLRNNVCPWNQIFEGVDSVGVVKCRPIGDVLHKVIDTNGTTCVGSSATNVRFEKFESPPSSGNYKVRVLCN